MRVSPASSVRHSSAGSVVLSSINVVESVSVLLIKNAMLCEYVGVNRCLPTCKTCLDRHKEDHLL